MSPLHPARPTFAPLQQPMSSSTNSSAFQSYSSTSSLATPSPAASAPLPSPSHMQPQHEAFFGSLNGQQQPRQHAQQQQQQAQAAQRGPVYDYTPNREGAGRTASETTNYLNQAALLAEAAKRAQMAVVMRDLDGMEL